MRLIAAVLTAVSLLVASQVAVAGPSGNVGEEGVGARADTSTTTIVPSPTTEPPVICDWEYDIIVYRNGRSESGGFVYLYIDSLYWRFDRSTGGAWVQAMEICRRAGTQVSSRTGWRPISTPDPEILAESVVDEVTRQVPLPDPAMSPTGPGVVNLGMWLAVEEPAPISVTARAGAVWATTTARLESTTFDMGDGTVVSCDGAGDPIPESKLDSIEPSEDCGHTYTKLQRDEVPYTVTITSTWRVDWVGSGGTGGDLGTLDRTSTVEYEVLEIQTVGTGD